MKKIENIVEASGLSADYLIALGSVGQYLKRVEEMHRKNLPPRWMHLAERTLEQRPIKMYEEYFNSQEYEDAAVNDKNRESVNAVNELVSRINSLWEQPEAAQRMRKKESPECKQMAGYYCTVRGLVLYGKKEKIPD